MFGRKSRENEHIIDLQEIYKNGVFSSYSNLDLVCNCDLLDLELNVESVFKSTKSSENISKVQGTWYPPI